MLIQVGEVAVLGDCGSCRLVETGETRIVNHGGIVKVEEVRKTGVWLERRGILWMRVRSVGVWVGVRARTRIGAGAGVLSCRVRVRVRTRVHHLPRFPTLLVLIGVHLLVEVAWLLRTGGEIWYTLGDPGVGMASR